MKRARDGRWIAPLLAGIAAVLAACSSSDSDLAAHLRLELGGTAGWTVPTRTSFALTATAAGAPVRLGRYPAVLTCGNRVLSVDVLAGAAKPRRIGRELSITWFWHLTEPELGRWLGGPGTYTLRATIGPVTSEPLVVVLPGPMITGRTVDEVRR